MLIPSYDHVDSSNGIHHRYSFNVADADGEVNADGNNTLVYIEMTDGDPINWAYVQVNLIVDGNAQTVCEGPSNVDETGCKVVDNGDGDTEFEVTDGRIIVQEESQICESACSIVVTIFDTQNQRRCTRAVQSPSIESSLQPSDEPFPSSPSTQPEADGDEGRLSQPSEHVPDRGIGASVQWHIVDPHVEVRPIESDHEDGHSERGRLTPCRNRHPEPEDDLEASADEDPESRVPENRWDDRFEPRRISEMEDANVGDPQAQGDRHQMLDPWVHDHSLSRPLAPRSASVNSSWRWRNRNPWSCTCRCPLEAPSQVPCRPSMLRSSRISDRARPPHASSPSMNHEHGPV